MLVQRTVFFAAGVNALGQVVVYSGDVGSTYQDGFLWTPTTGRGLIVGNFPPSFANGISNTGQVVGQKALFHFSN
jgi:uncharacterized membrane protein